MTAGGCARPCAYTPRLRTRSWVSMRFCTCACMERKGDGAKKTERGSRERDIWSTIGLRDYLHRIERGANNTRAQNERADTMEVTKNHHYLLCDARGLLNKLALLDLLSRLSKSVDEAAPCLRHCLRCLSGLGALWEGESAEVRSVRERRSACVRVVCVRVSECASGCVCVCA